MKIYPLLFSIFLAASPTIFSNKSKAKSITTDTKKSIEYNFEGDKKIYFYDDHKGAIKDYTESLKFNPRNTYALFNRANSKSELKDHEGETVNQSQDHISAAAAQWIKDHDGNQVPDDAVDHEKVCLLYTSPSPRDLSTSRMPSSA